VTAPYEGIFGKLSDHLWKEGNGVRGMRRERREKMKGEGEMRKARWKRSKSERKKTSKKKTKM